MLFRILATGVLVMFASMAQAVPVLTTSGATGVEVGGKTYDVEFIDGSCVDLFDGCDEVADFDFQTSVDAIAASEALLDLIEDTLDPDLKGFPGLMVGCDDGSLSCLVVTPYSLRIDGLVEGSMAVNDTRIPNVAGILRVPLFGDTTGSDIVYARWTEVAAVPLPASAPLLMAGMAGFAALARRRKRKAG